MLDELSDWQNRPLKKMYTFLFVDCMYVTIRKEYESKNYAVYTILGYGYRRKKDILGLHSAFDPKFNQIYSKQGLQKIHSIAEKGIWSSKSCSLPKSLWTKRGVFPNENALHKLLYLRITELYKKRNDSKVQNWAMVRNQLVTDDKIKARIEKYEH